MNIFKQIVYKILYLLHSGFYRFNFIFRGNKYKYFISDYNSTYLNERAVEIPISMYFYKEMESTGPTLEIGNVLKRYFPNLKHDVVDKYEIYENVKNEDIEFFKPKDRYKFILAVSTLEHVGFDGFENLDLGKLNRSIENITKNLLAPGGCFVATFPLKYNPSIDSLFFDTNFFNERYALQRGVFNFWKEVSLDKAKNGLPKSKTAFVRQVGIGVYFSR